MCVCVCMYQFMVHSEERHLTGFIEQVGEGDEGFGLLQVEDEHSSDEGHALDLKHRSQISTEDTQLCINIHQC